MLWKSFKYFNMCIIVVFKGKRKERELKKIFEEIMVKFF